MKAKKEIKNIIREYKGLEMYFSPEIAGKFAELEQNDKNFRVAEIVDRILIQKVGDLPEPIKVAELGGGAHPDRYHNFFTRLLQEPRGQIDWVDISPHMLELAEHYLVGKKYQDRREVITFIEADILDYLRNLEDDSLNVAIMKYTIDHITDLGLLFDLLNQKLVKNGKLVATIGSVSPELKSYSTNARFLYNGEQFPDNETRTLKDGDSFTVKFFKVSGNPNAGYLQGAKTVKYFHSEEKIKQLAEVAGFDVFLGDWKDAVDENNQEGETLNQEILILTKR
ncbi:MAG: methyltransferase domain-containing protein [bacterium]